MMSWYLVAMVLMVPVASMHSASTTTDACMVGLARPRTAQPRARCAAALRTPARAQRCCAFASALAVLSCLRLGLCDNLWITGASAASDAPHDDWCRRTGTRADLHQINFVRGWWGWELWLWCVL
jgi:hypothetical protein